MSEEVLDLCLDEQEDWLKDVAAVETKDESNTAQSSPQGNFDLEEALSAASITPTPSVASSTNATSERSSSLLQEDVTKPPTVVVNGIGQSSPVASVTSSTATTRTDRSRSGRSDSGSGSLFSLTTNGSKRGRKGRTKQTKVKLLVQDEPTNDNVYIVEEIVGKKMLFSDATDTQKTLYYHIKWKGWATPHNTWEPLENLGGCLDLVNAYEEVRTKRRDKGLDSDPEADGEDPVISEPEHIERTRKELVECGVEPEWPTELVPIEVVGVVNIDKHLCYLVRHQVKTYVESLTAENTVIVRAETFRRAFPHIVITYYESCVFWVDRVETKEELEFKSMRALEISQLAEGAANLIQREIEEEDEFDEVGLPLPKIAIENNQDLYGLPLPNGGVSSSSSDDEFEERPTPNPTY